MIGDKRQDKRPGKTRGFAFAQYGAQPFQKIIPIEIIEKNLSSINSPHDDVMQCTGRIYPCFSRHVLLISTACLHTNPNIRSTSPNLTRVPVRAAPRGPPPAWQSERGTANRICSSARSCGRMQSIWDPPRAPRRCRIQDPGFGICLL